MPKTPIVAIIIEPKAINMSIREADLSDAPAMAQVMVDSFLAAHWGQIPEEVWKWRQQNWTYEFCGRGWERTLQSIANSGNLQECVYVAEAAPGEIIGLAMGQRIVIETDTAVGEICALYLHPDHQRLGHGRQLVAAVASRIGQWDMTRLRIGTLKANAPARRFYEALGGRIVGEREVEDAGFLLPEVIYEWSELSSLVSVARFDANAASVYFAEDYQDLPFDVSKHRKALKSFEALKLAPVSIKPALLAREMVTARFPTGTFRIVVIGTPDAREGGEGDTGNVGVEVIYQADSPVEAEQVRRDVERYFLRHYPGRVFSASKDPTREQPSGECVCITCDAPDE